MNVLRARVREYGDWWEIRLLDLAIVADGATEAAMLKELEYQLTLEYHLAVRNNETPFRKLHIPNAKAGNESGADCFPLRRLNLPSDVKIALSLVLEKEQITAFSVDAHRDDEAKAA